jgi:hypothetical protein
MQVLCKLKGIVANVEDEAMEKELKQLKRAKTLDVFEAVVGELKHG